MIHKSIGYLDNFVALDLRYCTKLEKLPSYLKFKSLTCLELSGCSKLEMFPKIVENMKLLVSLYLNSIGIKELPSSIENFTRLKVLNLEGCTNLISISSKFICYKILKNLVFMGVLDLKCFPINGSHQSIQYALLQIMETYPKTLCWLSNADFLETLCDVNPFLNNLLLSGNKFYSLPLCLPKFMSSS